MAFREAAVSCLSHIALRHPNEPLDWGIHKRRKLKEAGFLCLTAASWLVLSSGQLGRDRSPLSLLISFGGNTASVYHCRCQGVW